MEPISNIPSCSHATGQELLEAEVYKIAVCTTATSGTGRYHYSVIKECYIPSHDCSFNILEEFPSGTSKINVWIGKRDLEGDSYLRPESKQKEAEDFGRKKIKIDPEISKKLCSLAHAVNYVTTQNKELTQVIETNDVLKTE